MPGTARTIFLVVHQGFVARYLLRSDILTTLKRAGCRIVVLAPDPGETWLQDEFADDDVIIEPLRKPAKRAGQRSQLWWWTLHLRNFAIANGHRTPALREKSERFPEKHMAGQPVERMIFKGLLQLLWRSRRLRRALLDLELRRYSEEAHRDLFERHRPDLVVTASPGYFKPDALLLREAASHGVPGATVVLSWDNPTSKGYRGADPDLVVTWSEQMRRQMLEFQDFRPEQVLVGGVPHFDRYFRPGALPSRDRLCASLGLDPERRIIVFATSSPGYYGRDHEIAETLAQAVTDGSFGVPAQLVIRVHPNFPAQNASLADFERTAAQHDHVVLDVPALLPSALACHMPADDTDRLMGLLRNCDVVVNLLSTTTLEAFAVDRPVVMIHSKGVVYEHLQPIITTGAAPVADGREELLTHVRRYLEHPELHREQRAAIAADELGPMDGEAGRRIAGLLLELAGRAAPAPAPLEPAAA